MSVPSLSLMPGEIGELYLKKNNTYVIKNFYFYSQMYYIIIFACFYSLEIVLYF